MGINLKTGQEIWSGPDNKRAYVDSNTFFSIWDTDVDATVTFLDAESKDTAIRINVYPEIGTNQNAYIRWIDADLTTVTLYDIGRDSSEPNSLKIASYVSGGNINLSTHASVGNINLTAGDDINLTSGGDVILDVSGGSVNIQGVDNPQIYFISDSRPGGGGVSAYIGCAGDNSGNYLIRNGYTDAHVVIDTTGNGDVKLQPAGTGKIYLDADITNTTGDMTMLFGIDESLVISGDSTASSGITPAIEFYDAASGNQRGQVGYWTVSDTMAMQNNTPTTGGNSIQVMNSGAIRLLTTNNGDIILANDGTGVITNTSGDLTITTGGGNGNITLNPHGTGSILVDAAITNTTGDIDITSSDGNVNIDSATASSPYGHIFGNGLGMAWVEDSDGSINVGAGATETVSLGSRSYEGSGANAKHNFYLVSVFPNSGLVGYRGLDIPPGGTATSISWTLGQEGEDNNFADKLYITNNSASAIDVFYLVYRLDIPVTLRTYTP
jgi:hypothetical protein